MSRGRKLLLSLGFVGFTGVASLSRAATANNVLEEGRVRIGLRLTPYQKVEAINPEGQKVSKFNALSALKHTLRARLEKPNHFYIGDYHIETSPQMWNRKTQKYTIKLIFYKRFGQMGKIEETMGEVLSSGILKGENDLFILYGTTSQQLQDKFGNPLLDVTVGVEEENNTSPDDSSHQAKTENSEMQKL